MLRGVTPASLPELPIGGYTVTLQREGWKPEERRVKVERAGKVEVAGEFAGGALRVTSEPAGAGWKITGAPGRAALRTTAGQTPVELKELPPGRYTVEVQRGGG